MTPFRPRTENAGPDSGEAYPSGALAVLDPVRRDGYLKRGRIARAPPHAGVTAPRVGGVPHAGLVELNRSPILATWT